MTVASDGFVLWSQPIDRSRPDVIRLGTDLYLDPADHQVLRSRWFTYIARQAADCERRPVGGGAWIADIPDGAIGEMPARDPTHPDTVPVVTVVVHRDNQGAAALVSVLASFTSVMGYETESRLAREFCTRLVKEARPTLRERLFPT